MRSWRGQWGILFGHPLDEKDLDDSLITVYESILTSKVPTFLFHFQSAKSIPKLLEGMCGVVTP